MKTTDTGERIYPDSKDGVIAFMLADFDLDVSDETFTPDPAVAGVWKVTDTVNDGWHIIYLGGYHNPWGITRDSNEAEWCER